MNDQKEDPSTGPNHAAMPDQRPTPPRACPNGGTCDGSGRSLHTNERGESYVRLCPACDAARRAAAGTRACGLTDAESQQAAHFSPRAHQREAAERLARLRPEQWAFVLGDPGVGKSAVAAAWLLAQARKGPGPRWVLAGEWATANRFEGQGEAIMDLSQVPLLVLDGIADEDAADSQVRMLGQVIQYRYRRRFQTLITSNLVLFEEQLPPAYLGRDQSVEARLGVRVADRIAELAEIIMISGPNLRRSRVRR